MKKHNINKKLLTKTREHYQILIKDRNKEISVIKQKNVFINQDIQNRKLQLNSLTAQIEEANFQNDLLRQSVNSKLEELNQAKIRKETSLTPKLSFSLMDTK